MIGAGINGAAIAREAALSGLKTLVIERNDLSAGTTGASSRLIHGGLRYLEYLELGLVRESLNERERLLRTAPHLVAPLELYIPVYAGSRRRRWQIAVGLTLYDWLSADRSLPRHQVFSRAKLVELLPGINTVDLIGGASYYDAQARFPERLVVENLRDAVDNGAQLRFHTRVTRVVVEAGRVTGVEWRTASGVAGSSAARLVVNAAGPWVDDVLGPIKHTRLIGGTKGSHLVAPRFPGAPHAGVYIEAATDARPLFILPWNGLLLVGTTDERFEGDPEAAGIDERELGYLARETERVFPAAAGLANHVLYTQTGVRPLPFQRRGAEASITRRHLIRRHRAARGLYSIVGGKLTTHRALAEDVLSVLRRDLPRLTGSSPTRERALPGALDAHDRDWLLAEVGAVLGAPQAQRLWCIYGAAAREVARYASAERGLATELVAGLAGGEPGPLAAELVYAREREWAETLGDILQRRCMAGLGADFGLAAAASAAQWLERVGVWDSARATEELRDYRELARRQGVALVATQDRPVADR